MVRTLLRLCLGTRILNLCQVFYLFCKGNVGAENCFNNKNIKPVNMKPEGMPFFAFEMRPCMFKYVYFM
jgi:hypothetical protein